MIEKTDTSNNSLCIEQLKKMSDSRCRNLLRYWIKLQGFDVAPRKVMQQIIAQVFYAKDDAMPDIRWSDIIVHRFKNRLYVLKNNQHDATQSFGWHAGDALIIDSLAKKLVMEQTNETGLAEIVCQQKLQVRFRQGGEKIQPAGRNGHHGLKKLFQEASVPPWERSRVPLIYLNDELIAVADYWIADSYQAEKNEAAYFPSLIDL